MLNKPRFKSCYSVETIEPNQVFILSERGSVCLCDRMTYLVASLIGCDRSSDEIIEAIQWQMMPQEANIQEQAALFQDVLNVSIQAQAILFKLEKEGYLVEQDESLPSHLLTVCHHLNISPSQADQRLKTTKVAVKAFGAPFIKELIATLQDLKVQIISDSNQADLTVVLTDDYLHPNLADFNSQALQNGHPWLLVKPVGTVIWLGPLFEPPQSACWQCLARRLQDNRPVESFIQRVNSRDSSQVIASSAPQGFLAATVQTALGMVATEVFKWVVSRSNHRLRNTLITYDTLTLQSRDHHLVKRPQCPSCGQLHGLEQRPLPVVLGHRKKTFTAEGGHRCCSPQETLSKYRHHISPITGVVRELTKIPINSLNHTYIAKHHFVTVFDDVDNLRKNLGGRSSGKGRTDAQARASGFCEAIERYSGVFQGDEIRIKSSYQKLGDQAIHPNACMNFSQRQYETRKAWNAQCQGWFQKVPEPFDQEREIDWTPVWSLTHQAFKYLPTAYCYYGYPQDYPLDCWADSNGCAAGNTIEEAILQGFMELVERDAVALWWYNRLRKPQVDLDRFDEPYCHSLKQYYQGLGRDLWVLDITSDLNIPTFAAISGRRDHAVEDIILGYGTHFDPKIAMSRALTELNQILPSVLSARADGTTQYPQYTDPLAIEWWTTARLAEHRYLVPDSKLKPKKYDDYDQRGSHDLLEDVQLCQRIVEEKNMELLVLDQTRADVGLRVVKVIVPGIRHMWRRLGLGRLYDIPVRMGLLKGALKERQLNAFPMWM
ncbi:TOMM precursor leader peptide-binding protein [Leptolyngbya sp. Heron Island J]|uniref:TOMM precursor leader peptide-binding protein n=1 Tax=Leptolyngbya sp. Heron Island J TaxID=1385935 RepID=UPI0004CF04BE|nr:TOMM precursor leader peptide-binding protein [Leptolyngbya sp. Heron Island J]